MYVQKAERGENFGNKFFVSARAEKVGKFVKDKS